MLHYIKGKIAMKFEGGVVVENNGMGYEVLVPDNSALYLSNPEEIRTVYLAMIVREDDLSLYGFCEQESLGLFRKLLSVNGVGAKAALSLLSAMTADALKKAIVFDDALTLTKANGIGKKTAQRIILDLKDKLGASEGLSASMDFTEVGNERTEAISGLVALGYSRSEAMSALASISEEGLTVESYIKKALHTLF